MVIDFYKFRLDYLDNGVDIFKMNNVASFIRQLNLYGFRKVGHKHRVTTGSQGRPELHVFRNDSFITVHPDTLPAVARKKGVIRAKVDEKDEDGGPGRSSGKPRQCHGPMHGGRVVHSQGNGMPSRHRQAAVRQDSTWTRLDALHRCLALGGHLCVRQASHQGPLGHCRTWWPANTLKPHYNKVEGEP